ncbi:spermatogenesis-associated protein 31D3-like [Mustela putorius furo]|uniref:Spermatogenesis-associated protein 31D3-like n=1 Tax=Mustela putorius furo TaxID=9669 RepID=A0A8U0SE89_MUSPF|nr:spermatogenesis-associated protein 31D3-like [Mustela putorius furo]
MHQQRPYPTTLEEGHLQQPPIQFFWGLQTPSRSFFPAADASDNISNASPEQESPVVPHPLPPSLPENPPQLLPQTQPLPLPHVQPQAHLQSPLPILPSGPLPDIKICGACFHRPQNESESLPSTEMEHLEWNVLQKVQECVWDLCTAVQRPQEDYCPSAPNPSLSHKATKAQVVISVPAGQFPLKEEPRRKLERSGTQPREWPKDDLLSDLESSSDHDMGYYSEKELRSPSEKNSTVSVETIGQRQLENVLKIHLRKKSEEISEGQLPGTVHNSWHTMKQTSLPSEKSQTELKQRSLLPSEVEDYSLNTFQELPFVELHVQQMLDAHIKSFVGGSYGAFPPGSLNP